MNKYLMAAILMGLGACGDRDQVQLIPGPKGEQGERGSDGEDGIDGNDGQDGEDGSDGQDGEQGPIGPQGPQGIPGLNGTTFEIVPLCPSLSGSYPEVLFRINGSLYAILDGGPHSDRLAYLPNGTYQTTDGRSCVFTVSGGNVL